ncbi:MAG: DUF2970 domain-containing protein [Nitrosomonas sp.]|uniref:DUF2970 domain-containing protein n=1 Tax=Nitrosomonas sp. TaxID=42353 RepID=UPI0025E33932|nr:DUF2970 domain-containing protein [Nitrosomonas sp.]MBY0474615.1 DUF2970 domain-containing protein [Nitrosomonas sp.]
MDKVTEKQTSVSIWQIAKAVFSAFIGIRKKSGLENDAAILKPIHVVVGGIIGGLLFVLGVMLLVKLVLS